MMLATIILFILVIHHYYTELKSHNRTIQKCHEYEERLRQQIREYQDKLYVLTGSYHGDKEK